MPYTNCTACGAKALVGATRCPRCQVPFVSYEFGGERVVTVNCPNCGVQRPVAIGVCPNCLMSTSPSGRRLARGLILIGLGIAAILTVGYLISRSTEQTGSDQVPAAIVADSDLAADSILPGDTAVLAAADSTERAASTSVAPVAAVNPTTAPATVPTAARAASPPRVAVPDTGRWEFATAKTWVLVRSAPTKESQALRMVDSAQRVQLGPPMNGWRPIRVGVDRGWVDPRFFAVVPSPRP
jgi:hypothetical protein